MAAPKKTTASSNEAKPAKAAPKAGVAKADAEKAPKKAAPKAEPVKKMEEKPMKSEKPAATEKASRKVKTKKPSVPVKKVIKESDLKKAKLASKEVKSSDSPTIEPVSTAASNKPQKVPGVANLSSKKEDIVVPKAAKVTKIPKITATGKIAYDPDFTHSVLDESGKPVITSTPISRYSDSDLAEFKELILRKMESARKELNYLQGLIARRDQGGDNDDGRYMTMEDGSISMEREQLGQMASRQIQFIDHLEKAMIRIENKTYGICRVTGKLIEKARLRAVPHATLSMEAKLGKVR